MGGGGAVMIMSQLFVDESKRVKHSMDTCHCIRRVGFAVSCESPPTPLSSPTPHPFPSPFSLFVLALLSISAPCVYLTPPPPSPSNPTSHNHRHSSLPPPPPKIPLAVFSLYSCTAFHLSTQTPSTGLRHPSFNFLLEEDAGKRCSECALHPDSKHWFTTSFLQPLPYLVTP